MKKETQEEFKDSLIQEIIKLKGLTGNYSFQFLALSFFEIPELIRIKNRLTVDSRSLDSQLLTTHLYIVIDEEHLETLKGSDGITAQFTDRQEADSFASERLEIWSIKEIFFKHRWIQHTPNY